MKVAETFEKKHQHVLRDIDSLKKDVSNFGHMFEETSIKDSYGREQRAYFMNRDGFTLLAMGYTGKKALQFKLKYIEAFNKMEKTIREQELPQTPEERLALTMEVTNRLDKRVTNVEEKIDYLTNTSELNETQRYQLLQARKQKVIQVCGGPDSNYYREKKAKKVFSQFGRDFKKAFKIPRYDSLQKQYFDEAMEFTKNWYPDFVLRREIQNVNAQITLGILQEDKNAR
ncbi:MAG: ORF6C domain [Bacteriophage sp.]|nr:MAG: ORF6C domain [Bacteriophage sp.]UWG88692.1 MAG: ORF6C domain [Bacteriophage sp.]